MRLGNRHLVAKITAMQEAADNILSTTGCLPLPLSSESSPDNGGSSGPGTSPSLKLKPNTLILSDIVEEDNPASSTKGKATNLKNKNQEPVGDGNGSMTSSPSLGTTPASHQPPTKDCLDKANTEETTGVTLPPLDLAEELEYMDVGEGVEVVENEGEPSSGRIRNRIHSSSGTRPKSLETKDEERVERKSPLGVVSSNALERDGTEDEETTSCEKSKSSHPTTTTGSSNSKTTSMSQGQGNVDRNHTGAGGGGGGGSNSTGTTSTKIILDLDDKSRFTEEITV